MTHRRVGLTADTYGPKERAAVRRVMASGRYTQGEMVASFEEAFLKTVKAPEGTRAYMVNSGSSANLLLAERLARDAKVTGKREVITTALTWSTTVAPLIQKGLRPVFVDIRADYTMDPQDASEAVGGDTLAVLIPHLLGNPAAVHDIADRVPAQTLIVEDCCEAFGARYKSQHVGTFGIAASFSFFYSHHLNTIEGGMLLVKDDEMSAVREHGWTRGYSEENRASLAKAYPDLDPRWMFDELGYNLRSTEVSAALGLVQLSRAGEFVKKRRQIKALYDKLLRTPYVLKPVAMPKSEQSPFFYPIRFVGPRGSRDGLRAHLEACEVETRPVLTGNITMHPWFQRNAGSGLFRTGASLDVTNSVHTHGLLLPLHPLMVEPDVIHVVASISSYLESVGLGRIGA